MSENNYIIDNTLNNNSTYIEHFCNQCNQGWTDRVVKSQCPNGCKNKGWAIEAPEYPLYCPVCDNVLEDIDYGDGQIIEKCYCPACDTIIVEDGRYEPIHNKIINYSCIGIITTIIIFAIWGLICSLL